MVERILEVTPFQKERLTQLEDGLANINNAERTMYLTGRTVLFMGDEDNEIQVDDELLRRAKGGLRGIVSELIYEYVPDPQTGRNVRVKNEEMGKVVKEIIKIAKIIRDQ